MQKLLARAGDVSGKELAFSKIGEPLNQLKAGVLP
jgi:hypothetical protein